MITAFRTFRRTLIQCSPSTTAKTPGSCFTTPNAPLKVLPSPIRVQSPATAVILPTPCR